MKLNEDILNDYTEERKLALVAVCPTKVFDYDEMKKTVFIRNSADCMFCKECEYLTEDFR